VKRWYYIVLGGILILGIVYIYLHRVELGIVGPASTGTEDASGASVDQTTSSATPAHIVWQKVDRAPDGFKVEMPIDSKEIQIPAYTASGGSEQVEMIYAYPDAETSYSVAWADNPPVARANGMAPDRTLDMARDDALARTQTTLVAESKTNRLGFPARDFSGRNVGGGVFNARLIMAGSRLYMLIASFPSAGARRDEDVARFMNSFTLTQNVRTN
jgi:hypothetical protein